jgi:hypothetical protein
VAPQVASMLNLVGRWIVPPMRLGQARSAEPPVLTLTMFRIGSSNSPETSPTTGGSPERAGITIGRTMVSDFSSWLMMSFGPMFV